MTHLMINNPEDAIFGLEQAIEIDPQHYKSLKHLAQILTQEKKFKETHQLYKTLLNSYPTDPAMIPDIIKIAMINEKHDDIVSYIDEWKSLAIENVFVRRNLAAGLAVCGKYLLKHNQQEKGQTSLKDAASLSNGEEKILQNIIDTYIEMNLSNDGIDVLKEYTNERTNRIALKTMELELYYNAKKPSKDILNISKELLEKGVKDPKVYLISVKCLIESGQNKEQVKQKYDEAITYFPELKNELKKYL